MIRQILTELPETEFRKAAFVQVRSRDTLEDIDEDLRQLETKGFKYLALCIVADLLRKSFSEYGVVTRYAGDEFVIMLNTTDDQLIQKIIKSAKKNFVTENEKSDKPYQLSASMGYAITNLSNETIDDFMNRIDEQMYQDKMKYYEHNDRRNSK